MNSLGQDFTNPATYSPTTVQELIGNVTITIDQIFAQYPPVDATSTNTTLLELLATLENQFTTYISDPQNITSLNQVVGTESDIEFAVMSSIMSTYGFGGASESVTTTSPSITDTDISTANITAIAGVYTGNATEVSASVEGTYVEGFNTAQLIVSSSTPCTTRHPSKR
jgi:hypothetical protein